MKLTESSLSELRHSSGTASEPRKTRRASSGKLPSPDESATKTVEKERFDGLLSMELIKMSLGQQYCRFLLIQYLLLVFY